MPMLEKDRKQAAFAGATAVVAYRQAINERSVTTYETIGDLLTDIRHFADAQGLNWQDAIDYMERHYRVESQ
jgi:hypothetical protein